MGGDHDVRVMSVSLGRLHCAMMLWSLQWVIFQSMRVRIEKMELYCVDRNNQTYVLCLLKERLELQNYHIFLDRQI